MQVDPNDQGNSDDDSLFGSPPSSPVRGRSPALALPSGGNCTQNVGTIALPGSHLYSELPVNAPALSLSGSSHNELAQRPPAKNTLHPQWRRPQVEPQAQASTLSTRSNSSQSIRDGKKKKKSSRENSTVPRPPPPPIHLPDPDAPPPAHFLRNQQALLGLAGLVGGVHPANLSVKRPPRGSNASNPIVVEDVLNPPPIGKGYSRRPTVDTSRLPPPSNEEIVASLIKEKNIFPVLESILKLIAGNAFITPTSTTQSGSDRRVEGSQVLPTGKRRKLDTVPAGATDWDVLYPFPNGGGSQNWERERGRQLIAQLVGLIKGAAHTAALRTYQQQARQREAHRYQQQQPAKVEDNEPKIRGHYRLRTATYGRVGAQASEVLADHSNTTTTTSSSSVAQPQISPSSLCEVQPSSSSTQPFPLPTAMDTGTTQPSNPFEQMITSLLSESPAPSSLSGGDDGRSTSEWSPGADTPSEMSLPDFDQNTFDSWMSILDAFPNPQSIGNDEGPSTSLDNYDLDSFMNSIANGFPMHNHDPNLSILDNNNTPPSGSMDGFDASASASSSTSFPNMNPDFAIDPVLLAMSMPTPTQQQQQPLTDFGIIPSSLPALVTSPGVESTSCSSADPLTPRMDVTFTDPDVFADDQDPLMLSAANMLLQLAPNASSSGSGSQILNIDTPMCAPMPSVGIPPITNILDSLQQSTQQKQAPTPRSRGSTEGPTAPAPPPVFKKPSNTMWPVRPMRNLDKQDVLARAKERRMQLVGEIDRAKVELWETTIEQGVLAHLVKEKL